MTACPNCQSEYQLHGGQPSTPFCFKCRFPLKILANTYRFIKKIGSGGFGVVYLAEHTTSGQRFAVKLLRHEVFEHLESEFDEDSGSIKQQEIISRFQQEIQVTVELSRENPHIVQVFDLGEDDELGHYYTMEYLEGVPLDRYLEEGKPLPYLEAFQILRQLCEAMTSAHQRGIVHRDLKPSNIFLQPSEQGHFVKVIDFGIAKSLFTGQNMTLTPGVLGSMTYISPEQGKSEKVDQRTDVYALAGIFYRLLTGTPPFTDESQTALLIAHLQKNVEPMSRRCPHLQFPAGLDEAILKAMEKNPNDRFADMDVFWEAVAPFEAFRPPVKAQMPHANTLMEVSEELQQALFEANQGAKLDPPPGRSKSDKNPSWANAVPGAGSESYLFEEIPVEEQEMTVLSFPKDSLPPPPSYLKPKVEANLQDLDASYLAIEELELMVEEEPPEDRTSLGTLSPFGTPTMMTPSVPTPKRRTEPLFEEEGESARKSPTRETIRELQLSSEQKEELAARYALAYDLEEGEEDDDEDSERTMRITPKEKMEKLRKGAHTLQLDMDVEPISLDLSESMGEIFDLARPEPKPPENNHSVSDAMKTMPGEFEPLPANDFLDPANNASTFDDKPVGIGRATMIESSTPILPTGDLEEDLPLPTGRAVSPHYLEEDEDEDDEGATLTDSTGQLLKDARKLAQELSRTVPEELSRTAPEELSRTAPEFPLEPEEPPKRSSLPLVIALVIILGIVGGVLFWQFNKMPEEKPSKPPTRTAGRRKAPPAPAKTKRPEPKQVKGPKAGSIKKLKELPGASLVWIPPGSFQMGSPANDSSSFDNESPKRKVTLTKGFWMWQTEATQEQYQKVMGTNPSQFKGCGPRCPVERVSWYQALAFANALSKAQKQQSCYVCGGQDDKVQCHVREEYKGKKYHQCPGYRLPTEAEWEYAARAGTNTPTYIKLLPTKDKKYITALGKIAWYNQNSDVTYDGGFQCDSKNPKRRCGTHKVMGKTPNQWGLHGMLGNVWEWCFDWYQAKFTAAALINPIGPSSGENRVGRGGSWDSSLMLVRAANRGRLKPRLRYSSIGLRVVRSGP